MPGSATTRGWLVSCDDDTDHLAFCWDGKHQRPELVLRRSIPSLRTPLSTLRLRPHDHTRMTRGRCSSLRLHRDGLAPSTFRRSPGAPVHHIIRVAPTSSKASPTSAMPSMATESVHRNEPTRCARLGHWSCFI